MPDKLGAKSIDFRVGMTQHSIKSADGHEPYQYFQGGYCWKTELCFTGHVFLYYFMDQR